MHTPWLTQAESDLKAARVLSEGGLHSQAIWFAGQAVEKAHKAVLVALGLRYTEKQFKQLSHATSEVAGLLPEALHAPVDADVGALVTTLENAAMNSRYPKPTHSGQPWTAPCESTESSDQEVRDAARLVEWCRARIARALAAVTAMRPAPPENP